MTPKAMLHNGFVLCVKPKHVDRDPKLLLSSDEVETFTVVQTAADCCIAVRPGDSVIASSEGSKFRVSPEDTAAYNLPTDAEYAWLFKDTNIIAAVN